MASDFRLKEQLPELTERIVQTYSEVSTINHLGHCPLPKLDVIVGCCEDLKEIIYPGFRRREGLHLGNVTYHVGELIDGLHDKLTLQIGRALRHDAGATEMCSEESEATVPPNCRSSACTTRLSLCAETRSAVRRLRASTATRSLKLKKRSPQRERG